MGSDTKKPSIHLAEHEDPALRVPRDDQRTEEAAASSMMIGLAHGRLDDEGSPPRAAPPLAL